MKPASPVEATPPAPIPRPRQQSRALLYQVLAWLWVFPSVGALVILGQNLPAWRETQGWREALRAVRLESWIALGLLVMHVIFVWLALRHRRREAEETGTAFPPAR